MAGGDWGETFETAWLTWGETFDTAWLTRWDIWNCLINLRWDVWNCLINQTQLKKQFISVTPYNLHWTEEIYITAVTANRDHEPKESSSHTHSTHSHTHTPQANTPGKTVTHITQYKAHAGWQRSGRWTVDSGQWTLDSGRWTVDSGQWTLDSGQKQRTETASAGVLGTVSLALSVTEVTGVLCGHETCSVQ
jgi:hypothetical protein